MTQREVTRIIVCSGIIATVIAVKMRVFVSFEDAVHAMDVDVGETVGEIKKSLQEKFGIDLENNQNKNDWFVALMHQRSSLQDNWVYSDLGIPAGTILTCRIEKRIEPTLKVICPRYDEAIEYKESFRVWQTLVATLRVMIQNSTGIHVSAFRLFSSNGVELFDCHPLKVYGIHAGDTVTMEIWHNVADLVKAARANDITDSFQALASFHEAPHLMRYHLQLGLFIAAHFGYHQLASQFMKCGARPNEPVGQHPSRDWCRRDAHPDNVKTPSHEAAQHGRLTCLHHFLMFNYAVLICKDAYGLTPCNVARRHKQTECFKLLIAEQFRIPTVSELSINVYSRVRKWCDRARDRARVHKDKTTMLLLTNAEVARQTAIVGQKVRVDGYSGNSRVDQQDDKLKGHRNKRRVVKSTAGSTNSSVRSRVAKETTTRKESPTVARNKENSFPRTASSSQVKQKQEVTGIRNNTTPARQDGATVSAISRGPTARISRNRVTTATKESTGRYVWKPFLQTDCVKDNEIDNDSVLTEDDYEGPRTRSMVAIHGSGIATQDRHLINGSGIATQDRHLINGSGITTQDRYLVHGSGIATQDRHSIHGSGIATQDRPSTNGSGIATQDRHHSTLDSARLNKESRNGKNEKHVQRKDNQSNEEDERPLGTIRTKLSSADNRTGIATGNSERRMRRRLSSGREAAGNSAIVMERHESRNNLRWTLPLKKLEREKSVDSADECLRVARETYRRKSWLGQLQMALVLNTNMHKRGYITERRKESGYELNHMSKEQAKV